jgi:hypothetical protein
MRTLALAALLLASCTGDSDVQTEDIPCDPGFVRDADGNCYPEEADTDTDSDTDTDTDTDTGPVDADEDGATADVDCDDADATRYPGASEVCDGVDQDCDGEVDEEAINGGTFFPDTDGDGYGATGSEGVVSCAPEAGYVANDFDCNDADAGAWPGNPDPDDDGDGVDEDCDGTADEAYDPCAAGGGGFEWTPTEISTSEDGVWWAELTGRGTLCSVSCSDSWVSVLQTLENMDRDEADLALPHDSDGDVFFILDIYDPGTGSGTVGTCEAYTSGGTVTLTVTWTGE